VPFFAIYHLKWLAAFEIFRATGMTQMFLKAPLDIGGDTGVQRAIVAADDVNLPVHAHRVL
jgi:hypothetical protein